MERKDFGTKDGILSQITDKLPDEIVRIWKEVDISNGRSDGKIIYSDDGIIFVTYDDGITFYQIIEEYTGEIFGIPQWPVSSTWQQWVTDNKSTTCQTCLSMQGRILPMNHDFWDDGIQEPPLHKNCNCKLVPLQTLFAGTATKDGIKGSDYTLSKYGMLPNELNRPNSQPTNVTELVTRFIAVSESFSATPYYATAEEKANGILTIGYGHVIKPGESFTILTNEEALVLLRKDIQAHIPWYFIDELSEHGVFLTQYEFDALVSLSFHFGVGILTKSKSPGFRKLLLSGKFIPEEIEAEFMTYGKRQFAENGGLEKRQKAEANMFNYGEYDLEYLNKRKD